MLSDYILIGIIVKPQGINGQVKIKPITDDPDRFIPLTELFAAQPEDSKPVLVKIDDITVREGFVYASVDHSVTRDHAENQRRLQLYIKREDAVVLREDRNFITDLVGCCVIDSKGVEIGKLIEVLQPGANDVYVIKLNNQKMMMLPALKKVIPKVDIDKKLIFINETLLEEVAVIED